MDANETPVWLRADQHADALLGIGAAFALKNWRDVASHAASLLAACLMPDPFTAAAVKLGLHYVFGDWFADRQAPRELGLTRTTPKLAIARSIDPYFVQGLKSARATLGRLADHEASAKHAQILMAQSLEAAEAALVPAQARIQEALVLEQARARAKPAQTASAWSVTDALKANRASAAGQRARPPSLAPHIARAAAQQSATTFDLEEAVTNFNRALAASADEKLSLSKPSLTSTRKVVTQHQNYQRSAAVPSYEPDHESDYHYEYE